MPDDYEIVEHNGRLYRARKRAAEVVAPTEAPAKKDDSYWGGTESWVD